MRNKKKKVRILLPPDADPTGEELFRLSNSSYPQGSPWSKKLFENDKKDSYSGYGLIIKDGKTVGYIGYRQVFEEAEITNLAIVKEEQKHGLAVELVEKWLEKMKKEQVEIVFLEVRYSNQAAVKLYKKMGFQQVAVRKNYYQNPIEDAIILNYIIEK
ncbi:MAG: ribosomal protein S18-alanine N-acetyltransferase [Pisciglobus halotolerans]|nr:ribosomal protein S18-alanine N-acetyltransferase [Pisciglobus halotolerans]